MLHDNYSSLLKETKEKISYAVVVVPYLKEIVQEKVNKCQF